LPSLRGSFNSRRLHPLAVWSVVAGALLAGLLLVLGLGGRVTPFVALQAFLALSAINGQTGGSDDLMLANRSGFGVWHARPLRSRSIVASEPGTGSARTSSRHGRAILSSFSWLHLLVQPAVQKLGITWMPAGDMRRFIHPAIPSCSAGHELAGLFFRSPKFHGGEWCWECGAPLLLLAFWYLNTPERAGWLRLLQQIGFRRSTSHRSGHARHHLGVINVEPFHLGDALLLCLPVSPEEWHSAWARWFGPPRPTRQTRRAHR